MSRTIKHMPWNIQALDAHAMVEQHDHSGRDCTLAPLTKNTQHDWAAVQECNWSVSNVFYYSRRFCGCRLCTDYYGRRWERKKDRKASRREARNIMKYGEE